MGRDLAHALSFGGPMLTEEAAVAKEAVKHGLAWERTCRTAPECLVLTCSCSLTLAAHRVWVVRKVAGSRPDRPSNFYQ